MSDQYNKLNNRFCLAARLFIYLILSAIIIESIVLFSIKGNAENLFKEDCVVEWMQFGSLILMSFIFFLASKKNNASRELYHIFIVLLLVGAARELDNTLEHLIHRQTWKIIATILLLYFAYFSIKNFKQLKEQFFIFLDKRSFGLMFSGFLVVMILSRLIGQKTLWKVVMGENYIRFAARVLEESCELFGYMILLMGAIECLYERYDKIEQN